MCTSDGRFGGGAGLQRIDEEKSVMSGKAPAHVLAYHAGTREYGVKETICSIDTEHSEPGW